MFSKKRIYMDFAAATPLHPEVARAMRKGERVYGNPNSPHHEAREARTLIEDARTRIARTISVKSDDIYFTGSGTESNNIAIHGVLDALILKGVDPKTLHIIVSGFEHVSAGNVAMYWEKKGVQVSYASPNAEGIITAEEVMKQVRPETVLISIVAVQSEIGQIQPLKDIRRALDPLRAARKQTMQELFPEAQFPILHSDASQSLMFVDLAPDRLGADLATYDAQKIMGPKGVGVLYRTSWVPLEPLMHGGRQERRVRPGTENTAGILGIAQAFEHAVHGRDVRVKRVTAVRDYFIALLEKELPEVEVNGGMKHRIANNVHISVPGVDGDYLAVLMDKYGIAVSPRSACIQAGVSSNTIAALGKHDAQATGTLRFSFTPWVSKRDVKRAIDALKKSIAIATGS